MNPCFFHKSSSIMFLGVNDMNIIINVIIAACTVFLNTCAALFTIIFENSSNSICCFVNFGAKRNLNWQNSICLHSQLNTPFQYMSTILRYCPIEYNDHSTYMYSSHFLVSEGLRIEQTLYCHHDKKNGRSAVTSNSFTSFWLLAPWSKMTDFILNPMSKRWVKLSLRKFCNSFADAVGFTKKTHICCFFYSMALNGRTVLNMERNHRLSRWVMQS